MQLSINEVEEIREVQKSLSSQYLYIWSIMYKNGPNWSIMLIRLPNKWLLSEGYGPRFSQLMVTMVVVVFLRQMHLTY